MLGMGRSPVSPVAKWIEKMASETVETKLPRLCHVRLLQLSEQTVDDDQITNCPRSADPFYGIDVSRFPFPVSRFPSRNNLFVLGFDGRFSKNEERVG